MTASGFLLGTRRRVNDVGIQIEWDDAALTEPMETTLAYFGFAPPGAAPDGRPLRLTFSMHRSPLEVPREAEALSESHEGLRFHRLGETLYLHFQGTVVRLEPQQGTRATARWPLKKPRCATPFCSAFFSTASLSCSTTEGCAPCTPPALPRRRGLSLYRRERQREVDAGDAAGRKRLALPLGRFGLAQPRRRGHRSLSAAPRLLPGPRSRSRFSRRLPPTGSRTSRTSRSSASPSNRSTPPRRRPGARFAPSSSPRSWPRPRAGSSRWLPPRHC